MKDLISVIVPIYNSEKTLKKCIESILQQTHKNIELILVNDGSKDKSLEVCKKYEAIDQRVILIDKKNEGVSTARNAGIRIAKGKFVGFVDSDDYIEKDMYETLFARLLMDNSQICVLYSYTHTTMKEVQNKLEIMSSEEAISNLFTLAFPTSLWAYLYKKEIIENNYLNEEIHFFEDFEFNYRILKNAKTISLCKKRLYNYTDNENSINNQKVNEKRITSLSIYQIILSDLLSRDEKKLRKRAIYFRSAFLIGIILNLSKFYEESEEKYFVVTNQRAKEMILDVVLSPLIPLKYKISIVLCSLNTKFFCKALGTFRKK